ncbi:MAG: hypothetical protein HWE21_05260 [Cytophagia bacterium]|nr:hypothetical protein [Cytophagia bacterium]
MRSIKKVKCKELSNTELIEISAGGWFDLVEKLADGIAKIATPLVGSALIGLKNGIKKGLT